MGAEDSDGSVEALQAHKVILSAASPILRDMLIKQAALAPHSLFTPVMLYLRGISAKDLGNVLEFIYKGSVSLDQHELDDFLEAAKSLQIPLDQEVHHQGAPKRSSMSPASSGVWKPRKKRPKVTGPKWESPGNLEAITPETFKIEPSDSSLEESPVSLPEEGNGKPDEDYKLDDISERISTGAAMMKDTFISENVAQTGPCGKLIKHRSSLNRHVYGRHANLGVKYQCPHCPSVARTKNSLGVHVCNYHPEMKGQGINYDLCAIYEDCY